MCYFLQAWTYVTLHFVELSKTEEFQTLEAEEIISLIKDDNLHAPEEEYICEMAFK